MRRRTLLAAMAGLGGCATTGDGDAASPTAADRRPEPGGTWTAGADRPEWERAAERRIDAHRRSDLAVRVVDAEGGDPIAGASVDLTLRDHAFDFSTAYNVRRHLALSPGHPYRERVGALFNEVVFENAHKWRQWIGPGGHGRADEVLPFLRERGLSVAGAPVVWQERDHDVLPEGVWDAVDAGEEGTVRELVREHIRTLLGHYVADHGVTDWVFLNEQLGNHALTDALSDAPPAEAPPLREWFALAAAVAPDATLAVNEYDVLSLDREAHRDRYADLVAYLAGGERPPDEVGFQAHTMGEGEAVAPDEQWSRLERFAGLSDADLVVSEFDTPGFDSERRAADYLYRFLKVVYSHPDAAGFRLWGFWDGQHWRDDAPLFRADWSPKPGYDAYRRLLFEEWHTDESGTATDGTYRTRADLGTYDVTVRAAGRERTVTRSVTDAGSETAWAVAV